MKIVNKDRATTFADLKRGDVFRWGYLWVKVSESAHGQGWVGKAVKLGDDWNYRSVSDETVVVRCGPSAKTWYVEPSNDTGWSRQWTQQQGRRAKSEARKERAWTRRHTSGIAAGLRARGSSKAIQAWCRSGRDGAQADLYKR